MSEVDGDSFDESWSALDNDRGDEADEPYIPPQRARYEIIRDALRQIGVDDWDDEDPGDDPPDDPGGGRPPNDREPRLPGPSSISGSVAEDVPRSEDDEFQQLTGHTV